MTRRFITLRGVPRRILWITSAMSYVAFAVGVLSGWPAWAYVLVAAAVWAPVLFIETAWMYRHYGWIALFYALVITQGGHFLEHVAQMLQIHLLGRQGPDARGVIGALDVEWVHLGFNTWVFVAVVALLLRFRGNPWLWMTLLVASWHQVEHTYIISIFLSTGAEGTPGLLAAGGRLGGGLDLTRPDLHFLYNIVETVPLFVAFGWQLRRTYHQWLAQAFPRLPTDDLLELTNQSRIVRRPAGAVLIREGEAATDVYVLIRGEAEVTARAPVGDRRIATLQRGQVFGESAVLPDAVRSATVRARTPVEILHLDGDSVHDLLTHAADAAFDLRSLRAQRTTELTTELTTEGATQ
jgi:CRP-like cAMP-binding protein